MKFYSKLALIAILVSSVGLVQARHGGGHSGGYSSYGHGHGHHGAGIGVAAGLTGAALIGSAIARNNNAVTYVYDDDDDDYYE